MAATDVETALAAFLGADTGVAGVVVDRIYPYRAPEGAVEPLLVYHRISSPSEHTKDGDPHFAHTRVQITAWSHKYSEVKAAIKAVRSALSGFTGPTLQGVAVSEIIVTNETDVGDPSTLEYGVALDVILIDQT